MRIIKDFNFKKILSLIWRKDGSPLFNAKGIAVGVFSGCFPFFGFQTLIGVFLAQLVNGNIVLAAIGTWISNPFTYIPLYFLNYKVGLYFFSNSSNSVFNPNLIKESFWQQGWFFTSRLILGSTLVGLFFALIFGTISYFFYKNILSK